MVVNLIAPVLDDLRNEVVGVSAAERVRDGFEVAIVGPPNAGKSTLLNYIAGRNAAITSDVAGTTRDVIEVRIDLDGLPVTFLDTAGLRDGLDEVEKIGIERTKERAAQADLRIYIVDDTKSMKMIDPKPQDIVVSGKSDVSGNSGVSGVTGQGVDKLLSSVSSHFSASVASIGSAIHIRHRLAMEQAIVLFSDVLVSLGYGEERLDIAAEEMRRGLAVLDSLVGRVGVEDVLDDIFSRFCIGK